MGPKGENGAWVGKHRVVITTGLEPGGGSDARPTPGAPVPKEKVPAKYNNSSQETFTVSPDGTSSADFALTAP
jgi:hypothetical protein